MSETGKASIRCKTSLPMLCILSFINACHEDSYNKFQEFEASQFGNSCHIVLTEQQNKKKLNYLIQQIWKPANTQLENLVNLEKLGWFYIEQARNSYDPGFYKLAEQTALCMQSFKIENISSDLLLGHSLHNMHRFAEAEQIARNLVEMRGEWFDYGLLGDTLFDQGKFYEAVEAYQHMMDLHPGPEAYNRASNIRWLAGDIEGAIEMLQLSLNSTLGLNTIDTLWPLVRMAELQLQSGELEQSKSYLNNALKRQADYAPALLILGKILLDQNNKEHALRILTKAMTLNPLPEYRWALIEALELNQQKQKREQIEKQLFDLGETEDRRTFALYLASTKQKSDLAVALAKQELQQRKDVYTLDVLAWALWSKGQFQAAKHYSDQSLKQGNQDVRLFYHAGVIAAELGYEEEAKNRLKVAKKAEAALWPSEREHLNRIMIAF